MTRRLKYTITAENPTQARTLVAALIEARVAVRPDEPEARQLDKWIAHLEGELRMAGEHWTQRQRQEGDRRTEGR